MSAQQALLQDQKAREEIDRAAAKDRRLLLYAASALVILALAWTGQQGWSAWKTYEQQGFQPVEWIKFHGYACEDGKLMSYGSMLKNGAMVNGREQPPRLLELIVYSVDPKDIILARLEAELVTRPPGLQDFNPFIPLPDHCGKSFTIHTVHSHPANPEITLRQGWGPFGPDEPIDGDKRLY